MAVGLEQFSSLVCDIYRSALEPEHWQPTLSKLADMLGGSEGALAHSDARMTQYIQGSRGMNSAAVTDYDSYYWRMDPVAAFLPRVAENTCFDLNGIIPPAERHRSEFFTDWAFLHDMGDGIFANLLGGEGEISWLCCCAPMAETPFSSEERMHVMRLLVPHFQQALRIQSRLGGVLGERDSLLNLLQYARHGVIFAAHNARVLFANGVAQNLFAKGEGIDVRAGELHTQVVSDQVALRALVNRAGRGDADGIRRGGSLTLKRRSGGRDYAAHVLPLGEETPDEWRKPTVLILIVDPDTDPEPQAETLRRLYRLTKAEAAVAILIPRGEGLQAVADALQISLSTARIHLQRVFEKTGTHRQAELVRLVLTVQAGIRMPDP